MRDLDKPSEGDAYVSSSINRLPDEILLQILKKLVDLKALCFCYLVSRRFSSIVLQVDAISFTAPLLNLHKNTVGDVHARTPILTLISLFYRESYAIVKMFLAKFKKVKSLSLELPSSSEIGIDNRCLFKWKAKMGTKFDSVIFLSPNSVSDKDELSLDGNVDEEETDDSIYKMYKQNFDIAMECVKNVTAWREIMLDLVKNLPTLEKVSITGSGGRGRLSLSGEKLSEVKEWMRSSSESEWKEVPNVVSHGHIPVLKLPVSGYVMKGVYFCVMEMKDLQGKYDDLINCEDGFEGKEGAAYSEAVMEILENHKDRMVTVFDIGT